MKKDVFDFIKTILIAMLVALIITYIMKPTLVKGSSMQPTLESNDYLIIEKIFNYFNPIENNDIVVFASDLENINGTKKDLIKRVIAIPHDKLEIKNGKVYINDKEEKCLSNKALITSGEVSLVIPEGKYFVLGDNRDNSIDSRSKDVGLVSESSIEGKVILRVFPFDKIGRIK